MNILTLVFVAAVFATAGAQTPRQVGLVVAEDSAGVQVAALTVDEIEGVLAIDLNIVLDADRVNVLEVQPTDLLPGFFAFYNVVDDTLKFAAASAEAAPAGSGVIRRVVPGDCGRVARTPLCPCRTQRRRDSSALRASLRGRRGS